MDFDVHISEPAENDIGTAYRWWRDNRSAEQANRWFHEIHNAVATLSTMPLRCPRCEEEDLQEAGIRQLLFGIGRRPTHRIIFEIADNRVNILRVRHVAQKPLEIDEIEQE
ncbi:MAG: type II toxin-antitoxin system RelE/ParE family toxin [Bythopirellula sp.]|nr:type II toxin-antitoxin system RelE/ParE family toxin [Bythopirellula sp.]